jgi:hypothetical protein
MLVSVVRRPRRRCNCNTWYQRVTLGTPRRDALPVLYVRTRCIIIAGRACFGLLVIHPIPIDPSKFVWRLVVIVIVVVVSCSGWVSRAHRAQNRFI